MAITRSDLLIFNDVESTDAVFGALELPYIKPLAYIPNVTFSTAHEDFVKGRGGMGSKVLIRELGKGTVKTALATASGGLDYTHAQTADSLREIDIKQVISKSEKIYEAIEVARQSKSGAQKAELVLDVVLEKAQEFYSGYLTTTATTTKISTDEELTVDNFMDELIDAVEALDYKADILMVNKATHGLLLKLLTSGHFRANPREEVLRTGIVGQILDLDVVVDYNLDGNFVVYAKDHFPIFNLFNDYDIVPATDFKGAYARAQLIVGGGGKVLTAEQVGTGAGIWAIRHDGKTPA